MGAGEDRLYDTSAVIELVARRRRPVPGAVAALTVVEYPPAAAYAVRVIYPRRVDYEHAAFLQALLRRRGSPVPAVDLVIAAVAVNRGMKLVTLDKHFRVIEEVEPRLRVAYSLDEDG